MEFKLHIRINKPKSYLILVLFSLLALDDYSKAADLLMIWLESAI